LPARVKSGKSFSVNQVCVLRRKGLSLFMHVVPNTQAENLEVTEITFEELLEMVACEYDTPYVQLSPKFWPAYNEVKDFKPNKSKKLPPKSLDAKAHENLKCALRVLNPSDHALMDFIKVLIRDVQEYKTLSDRTLGRLSRNILDIHALDKDKKNFTNEVLWIRNSLGANYLERILKRIEHQRNEVVIALLLQKA